MGEAVASAMASEDGLRWRSVQQEPPPQDGHPLAVVARIDCPAHELNGALVVLAAARKNGRWWINFGHELEVTHWMRLPAIPSSVVH